MKKLQRSEMKNLKGGLFDGGGGGGNGTCTASANCTGCPKISCSGTSSCSAQDDNGVTCDGVKTSCRTWPNCS